MGDSLITITVIAVAGVLMFFFPLMTMAEQADDVSQLVVDTETTQFVDNVRRTGSLTAEEYDAFVQKISSTGNTHQIDIEAKLTDINPNIKTTQVTSTKIGDTQYYCLYTAQIEEILADSTKKNTLTFKEGDIISVSVKNTNKTIAELIKDVIYQITGNDSYQVGVQHAGMVTTNGSK